MKSASIKIICKNRAVTLAMVLACTMAAPAFARDTLMLEPAKIVFSATPPTTLASIRKAILTAAQSLQWQLAGEEDGRLLLSYDKNGKHRVNIAVAYDLQGYQVSYLTSYNLNYSEDSGGFRKIHPNYNRWI